MSNAILITLHKIRSHRFALMMILLFRLRPVNIFRVAIYRTRLKRGFFFRALPCVEHAASGNFWDDVERCFAPDISKDLRREMLVRGDEIVAGIFRRFEDEAVFEGERPQWYKTGYLSSRHKHFSTIGLNTNPGEDVKLCWDLSRFKWLTQLVVAAVHASSDSETEKYLLRAHFLLKDWVANNTYFSGVNWACGQEVAIRSLHLMNSLLLLNKYFQARPGEASIEFLQHSYERVELTIAYSMSQENNHSLTESLFLYYVPFFLERFGYPVRAQDSAKKRYARFRDVFSRLVQEDGSFRMYSLNYHRAVCDILALSKVIDDALSVNFWTLDRIECVGKMHHFLSSVVASECGGAPNIGHNDGSLHVIQYAPYSCYTPSLLFMGSMFSLPVNSEYKNALHKVYCFDRTVQFVQRSVSAFVECFDDFGLVIVKRDSYKAFLKYARNKGRPQQQDFMHLDLWVRGVNLLHDSGSYSYNPEDTSFIDYFDEPAAHNGPFLLGQGFVKRLSRFLFLEWPNAKVVKIIGDNNIQISVSLKGSHGCALTRNTQFFDNHIDITDTGPSGLAWGVCFNVPFQLTASNTVNRLELGPGVLLKCDVPLKVGAAFYSKRYLDINYGSRITARAIATGVNSRIQIQDLS